MKYKSLFKMTYKNKNLHNLQYAYIDTGSDCICFMFSGAAYSYDKPLFYYSTMNCIEHQIDVVHFHYQYDDILNEKSVEDISTIISQDCSPVINEILLQKKYKSTFFLGKSLGTIPIILHFMNDKAFSAATFILLTPLLMKEVVFDNLMKKSQQGLLVIGDRDAHYNQEKMEKLQKTNLEIKVVQNANHALDMSTHHTLDSIQVVMDVMSAIQRVLN